MIEKKIEAITIFMFRIERKYSDWKIWKILEVQKIKKKFDIDIMLYLMCIKLNNLRINISLNILYKF